MQNGDFVHLRVHTAYSLSEGAIRVKDLAKLCVEHGMPAVAITDTNNLFGGMEFSASLRQVGVQPIIGCQLALTMTQAALRPGGGKGISASGRDAVVVLVQNGAGYANLLRLLALAYGLDDAQSDPRVALADLCTYADGLILLTGGPDGPVGRLLLEGRREAAESLVAQLRGAFGDRLYVELLRHGLESEAAIEPALLAIAAKAGLPIVATNDAYFATADMYEAHDALLCISQGTHLADNNRRRLTQEHSFKSGAEMRALFSDLPDAVANTALIARRCAFAIDSVRPMLPPYDCGEGRTEEEALREDARRGLEGRLAALAALPIPDPRRHPDRAYLERLEYELDVICGMGFAGYFLIVAEFIGWAKERGIPVGPGRGSGAGSVVAWALGITDLDPLRFGLLFERFLNPERVSMPDFDIDFCQDRRDEVIRHVQQKYGHDRVAQIITFGKLQARAVLRDVGRVMGLPYGQVDRICKLVPNNPANPVSLDGALKAEPQLQAMVAEDDSVARLVDIAKRLEGLYRHASTHAAGVVISDRPLMELIPLYRDPRSDLLVTGFNMKWVEAAGLVKFDFLGLKTLTVLAQTIDLVRRGRGEAIDLGHLPLDDRATFEMLGRGDTVGVFQLESAGMRDVLRKLEARHLRGHHRRRRPVPAGPDGQHPELHPPQARRGAGRLSLPDSRRHPARDARHHDLPGAGDADRPGTVRLLARQRRPAAPRHGQEDQGGDGSAARHLRQRRRRARRSRGEGEPGLRAGQQVRGIRLQQIARGGVRADRLPDRLPQGQLSAGVLRRVDDARSRQQRQAQRLPPGTRPSRHPPAAARRQCLGGDLRRRARRVVRADRRHPLRARRAEDGRRTGGARRRRGTPSRRALSVAGRLRATARSAPPQQAPARKFGPRRRLRFVEHQQASGVRERRGDHAMRRRRQRRTGERADRPVLRLRLSSSRRGCTSPKSRTGRRWSG